MRRTLFVAAIITFSVVLHGAGEQSSAPGPAGAAAPPTFTKDVAAILNKHCVSCHRPDQTAPMSLMSYQEVRPWARSIRQKVAKREMPPWLADPEFGHFRNDRRLDQKEVDTIVAWVDAGVPKGDDKDLPPVPQFSDAWRYGTPDYVIDEPIEFDVPAEGEGPVLTLYSQLPFAEDRYLEKVEMKPSNEAVVHHANVHFEPLKVPAGARYVDGQFLAADGHVLTADELRGAASVFDVNQGQLISYVPGRGYEAYWPGTGKILPATTSGQWLVWNVHYTPTGRPERDRTRIGLYFSKTPVNHVVITSQIGGSIIVEGKELLADSESGGRLKVPEIPPYAENWSIKTIMPIAEDITLYGFQPHAHLRSKHWQYVVTYPDGKEEILLSVQKYDFNWQLHYELNEPKRIPAGSRLMAVGTYDNSVRNRYNPAPEKHVYWSEQSWDEMFQPKIEYSIDSLERKAK